MSIPWERARVRVISSSESERKIMNHFVVSPFFFARRGAMCRYFLNARFKCSSSNPIDIVVIPHANQSPKRT
jgi:hypothetical protein